MPLAVEPEGEQRERGHHGRTEETAAGAGRGKTGGAAGLDDAAGGALSARIPRHAGAGGRFPVAVLQPRSGHRSDAATDPPFRAGRGDPVCRHPAGAPGAGGRPVVCHRRGAAPVHHHHAGRSGAPETRERHSRDPRPDLPDGCQRGRRPARADRLHRLCRGALDGGHLHDRRARHPRSGPRPQADRRGPRHLRGAAGAHHRGHDRISLGPDRGRGRGGQTVRQLGGIAQGGGFHRLCARAHAPHHRRPEGAPPGYAGDRLSARGGRELHRFCPCNRRRLRGAGQFDLTRMGGQERAGGWLRAGQPGAAPHGERRAGSG